MSDDKRRSLLLAAAADAELVRQVPAVVAAGFGVLALRRSGQVLTVACFPAANRAALRLLRDVLGVEILASPFDERALHEAIRKAYFPREETVNFPTFADPDFLERPENAAVLAREKVEDVGPVLRELDPDRLVLATLTYRSVLRGLDLPRVGQALPDPARVRLDLGGLDVGWQARDGRYHVYPDAGLRAHVAGREPGSLDRACALLTEYRLSQYRHVQGGGRVGEHGVATSVVCDLPHVIHPTEVQLTGVARDGALTFHVYDRARRVEPGQAGEGRAVRLRTEYCFLSYGSRLQRVIEVDVHEAVVVRREALVVHAGAAPWGPPELARWLGLDPPGERVHVG